MKSPILILFAAAAFCLVSCQAPGGSMTVHPAVTYAGAVYAGKKYLGKAKTPESWFNRRQKLRSFTDAVESANEDGINAETLKDIALQVTGSAGSDELDLLTAVVAAYVPPDQTLAPKNPQVSAVTTGFRFALNESNPFDSAK